MKWDGMGWFSHLKLLLGDALLWQDVYLVTYTHTRQTHQNNTLNTQINSLKGFSHLL